MAKQMSEEEVYEEAKKRVKARKDFYLHLAAYLSVNGFLIIIWAVTMGGGFAWFVFPLGGWGIGLVMHFFEVFVRSDRAAVEKEMEKLKREQKE